MIISELIDFLKENLLSKRTDVTTPRSSTQYLCSNDNSLQDQIEVRTCDYHEYFFYSSPPTYVLIHTVGNIKIFNDQILIAEPTIKLVFPTTNIVNIHSKPIEISKVIDELILSKIDFAPNIDAIKERLSLSNTKLFDKQILIETTHNGNLINYQAPINQDLRDDFHHRVVTGGHIELSHHRFDHKYISDNNRHFYRLDHWMTLDTVNKHLEIVTLYRRGEPNLSFRGLVLCRINNIPLSYKINTKYQCLELYISLSGTLIAVKREVLKKRDFQIKEINETKIINSLIDLVNFFGMSNTAKALYSKVKLNHSVYI